MRFTFSINERIAKGQEGLHWWFLILVIDDHQSWTADISWLCKCQEIFVLFYYSYTDLFFSRSIYLCDIRLGNQPKSWIESRWQCPTREEQQKLRQPKLRALKLQSLLRKRSAYWHQCDISRLLSNPVFALSWWLIECSSMREKMNLNYFKTRQNVNRVNWCEYFSNALFHSLGFQSFGNTADLSASCGASVFIKQRAGT